MANISLVFPCKKCGACCRAVNCRYLNKETNLCKIYNTRPLICRTNEIYKRYFKNIMTQQKFYDWTENCCKILRERIK